MGNETSAQNQGLADELREYARADVRRPELLKDKIMPFFRKEDRGNYSKVLFEVLMEGEWLEPSRKAKIPISDLLMGELEGISGSLPLTFIELLKLHILIRYKLQHYGGSALLDGFRHNGIEAGFLKKKFDEETVNERESKPDRTKQTKLLKEAADVNGARAQDLLPFFIGIDTKGKPTAAQRVIGLALYYKENKLELSMEDFKVLIDDLDKALTSETGKRPQIQQSFRE